MRADWVSRYIRSILLIRSASNAVAMSLPVLASILSFVTYSLSGHSLNPAVIFTSLTLFTLLRMPLMLYVSTSLPSLVYKLTSLTPASQWHSAQSQTA